MDIKMSQIPPVIPLDGTTLSFSSDSSPISQTLTEESNQVPLISSSIRLSTQQNHFPSNNCNTSSNLSGTIDSIKDKSSNSQTAAGCLPDGESSRTTMVMVTSPSYNDDLSSEQNNSLLNESTDKVNLSSLSYLQTKQRRINHRRNKSEPFKCGSIEDLSSISSLTTNNLESSSTSTTSNESAISSNASTENKRKSSIKTLSNNISPSNQINGFSQLQDKNSSSAPSKKRKSWYNPFQSTYRQRNEEFRKTFKELPSNERLIVDYSCAWQKEILIQGRMYLSQSYLCFHANFLKWETSLCLKFQDIVGITREKTAKVIPNAIEIRSNKGEKYFFASFATRDKTYTMIYRIWQTILVDLPISSQHLWKIIHENYGNDLDMTTDEEDNYHRKSINSTPDKTSPKQQIKNDKYHRVTENSIRGKSSEKEEIYDHSSISSRDEHQTDDDEQGIIPIGEEANTNTLIRQPNLNLNKEDNCLTSMATPTEVNYLLTCPCQTHLATQIIDRTYPMSVEKLFDYIFGDNDFLVAYRAARRIKDYHASQWEMNGETEKRERLCTYKVSVAAVFGATVICSNEKQIIECELPKSHYIIDTEVRNEGIKYADAFFVATRYCLVQIGPNKSHLKVSCEVRYVKSLMIIIKSFIEKNAMAALQDSFTDLMKRIDQESSHRTRSSSKTNTQEKDKTNQSTSKKKHPRKQQSIDSSNELSTNRNRKQSIQDSISTNNHNANIVSSSDSLSSSRWSTNNLLIPLCLITMLLLLTVNIFLCVKLNQIDRMTDRFVQNYPLTLNEYSYPKEDNEWSILLKRQEEYYQTKLTGLHSVLTSTHNALKNVTDALSELSKASSGSNSKTPIDRSQSL